MKVFNFLVSLPRSGNTLLGSILNQNHLVKMTANTLVTDILHQLHILKNFEIYKNFPDEKSLDNVIKNVFNNYYKYWKCKFIIDRGPWGTPANLQHLKNVIKKPKFIILYRPVLECLASFIKIEKPENINKRCHQLMATDGIIGKNLWSIKNLLKEKNEYIVINYANLIEDLLKQINRIYTFLNIDNFNHKLENFDDFSTNNIKYNDSVFNVPLHKIRTNRIELNKYNIENYLPANIIKQYSNLDI